MNFGGNICQEVIIRMVLIMFKKILFAAGILFAVIPAMAHADTAPLTIAKQVRNITQGGSFATNANAVVGDELEFEVTVQNVSQATLPLVTVSEVALSSMQFGPNIYVSRAYAGQLGTPGIQVGSLEAGGTVVIRYRAIIATAATVGSTLCSISNVATSGASASTTVCAYVQSGAVVNAQGLVRQSVSASNDTKNISGTSVIAQKEDFLTYTFTATNAGTVTASNYAVVADISGILPLVDVVDLQGGVLNGSVVSYSGADILPGASVVRTLRVRVKYYVPPYGFRLTVQYGNEAVVAIPHTTPLATGYVAPNTGKTRNASPFAFAGIIVAGAALVLSQKRLRTLLFS